MKITGTTLFTGILGYPIEHTFSPVFQNAAFEGVGLNWVYLPFEVRPDGLKAALDGLAACGCRGLNVTMPHKRTVVPLLSELAQSASLVGAVNTIEFKGERSIGHNTDGMGFAGSLAGDGFDPAGKSALIIGAGGAAQSIALALAEAGASGIKVLNRTPIKAEELVGLIRANFPGCSASVGVLEDPAEAEGHELIVNTTSVGMHTNPGQPFNLSLLQSGQIVYDIIYWPTETEFLHSAKSRGARTINGVRMLLQQGAESFKIWTGIPAPVSRMADALEASLDVME